MKYYYEARIDNGDEFLYKCGRAIKRKKELEMVAKKEFETVKTIPAFIFYYHSMKKKFNKLTKGEKVFFTCGIAIIAYFTMMYMDVIFNNLSSGELSSWNLMKYLFKR